jgi:Bacterial SH3 domain
LRWPATVASATYLFFQHSYGLAVVALLWPLLATVLSGFSVWLAYACGTQADVFEMESKFFERVSAADSANSSRSVRTTIGLVMVSAIGVLALGSLANPKQRTPARMQTKSQAPHDAAATKSQTSKTPPSPAAPQGTLPPLLSAPQPTPTPLDPAPVVIGQPKPAPLESGSQNFRPDASLPKAKATYRISGVMADDFLNMRQGPGISYPVIQRLQNGVDGVTLIGGPVSKGRARWQKINSRGVVGWVNADYLAPSMSNRTPQSPLR